MLMKRLTRHMMTTSLIMNNNFIRVESTRIRVNIMKTSKDMRMRTKRISKKKKPTKSMMILVVQECKLEAIILLVKICKLTEWIKKIILPRKVKSKPLLEELSMKKKTSVLNSQRSITARPYPTKR